MVFFLIGIAALALLLLGSIFGGGHEGGFGHDVGGDFGDHDIGHDFGHDIGHDVGHGEAEDSSAHGPSPVSFRTICIFVMIFGFSGYLACYYKASNEVASLVGIGAGFIAAVIAYKLIKWIYSQQGSSIISVRELIGKTGEVTSTIPADGVGEVAVIFAEQRKDLLARSRGGVIPNGTKVKIVEDLGGSVLVSKVE